MNTAAGSKRMVADRPPDMQPVNLDQQVEAYCQEHGYTIVEDKEKENRGPSKIVYDDVGLGGEEADEDDAGDDDDEDKIKGDI